MIVEPDLKQTIAVVGDTRRRAWALMLLAVVPQCALLLVNASAWDIAKHLANDAEVQHATYLLIAYSSLLAFNLAVTWRLWRLAEPLEIKTLAAMSVALLVAHATVLILLLRWLESALPDALPDWMLNRDNLFYCNVAMLMPAAFGSLYQLVRLMMQAVSTTQLVLTSLGSIVGLPTLWYLFATLSQPFSLGQFGVIFMVVVSVAMVMLFLAGVIAILDLMLNKRLLVNTNREHLGFVVLLGLIAPIGGLLLNAEMLFPGDFQSPWVYTLTVINALVLALPLGSPKFAALRLYCRAAVYPFIAYFFLVFLPFLPLSILAVLFMGAGLLMLTPLALGIFQTRITWLEFLGLRQQSSLFKATAVLILGLLTLPVFWAVNAKLDQLALYKTLDYFYAPEQIQSELNESARTRAARAVITLRDRKQGVQLPYIAGVYNHIVYQGMVLSDRKIEQMHRWLTGQAVPSFKPYERRLFGSGSGRGRRFAPRFVAPDLNTEIERVQVSKLDDSRSAVQLVLRNNSATTHAMYQTRFQLPDGVFVSGLRLKIGDKWVPAKIQDKKTALWVFEKITEVRRDPAIVFYRDTNSLELRVYPFPGNAVREVELQLSYHPSAPVTLRLDQRDIVINQPRRPQAVVLASDAILLNTNELSNYAYQRQAYLHFVLPFGASGNTDPIFLRSQIQAAAAELEVELVAVSAANIDVDKQALTLVSANDTRAINEQIKRIKLARRGGLWLENAFNRLIDRHHQSSYALSHRPIYVVLAQPTPVDKNISPHGWSAKVPDSANWYRYSDRGLSSARFGDSAVVGEAETVVVTQTANEITVTLMNELRLLRNHEQSLNIYSASELGFTALPIGNDMSATSKVWSRFADLVLQWQQANTSAAELERQRLSLLQAAQSAGLVLPTTAAIVVENGAQWATLSAKEKQAMGAHSALDFEDQQQTPEPAEWLMLLALALFLSMRHLRRRCAAFVA